MLHNHRRMDEWYVTINKIYLDRNFYRHPESVFAHLAEIVGGLSLLASEKSKPGIDPQRYIAKAIAWWMALCGKMGIRSVENMVWTKFPNVCPYCEKRPHNYDDCNALRQSKALPDWDKLFSLAETNEKARPGPLGAWLDMFTGIYPLSGDADYRRVFARFSEEMGELSEATRLFQLAPGYFFSEASDFFAWLMHLQAVYVDKTKAGNRAQLLEDAMRLEYPDGCKDCGSQLCTCPPVLKKTFGRIAHEMPKIVSDQGRQPLLTLDEAMEMFELSSSSVNLGGKELEVNLKVIGETRDMVMSLRSQMLDLMGANDAQSGRLLGILTQLSDLTTAERVTQRSLDELSQAIADLPTERRKPLLNILEGTVGSAVATGLLAGIKLLLAT